MKIDPHEVRGTLGYRLCYGVLKRQYMMQLHAAGAAGGELKKNLVGLAGELNEIRRDSLLTEQDWIEHFFRSMSKRITSVGGLRAAFVSFFGVDLFDTASFGGLPNDETRELLLLLLAELVFELTKEEREK